MKQKIVLAQRGQLDSVLSELITKQQSVINDIEKCLPLMTDIDLINKLTKQKEKAEKQLEVLKEGFVPIVGGWFWNIDTKSKWGKGAVKEIIETMPEEIKEVMENAKQSGIFEKVKVNGSRRGDPLLVGTAGGKNFLLAMWVNLEGNYSIGFTSSAMRSL